MNPHHRGVAARAALAIAMASALLLGFLPTVGRAQQGAGARSWQRLSDAGPLAGHVLLNLPDGRLLALGGESSPGVAGPGPLVLDLSRPAGGWTALTQSGDLPVSRLTGRGLLGAAAIVDPAENLLFLTCDCAEGHSAYTLDLGTGVWRSAAAADGPVALWYPILAYDAPRDRAVLIGGDQAGTGELSGAVWAYDLSPARAGWTRLGDAGWTSSLLFGAYAVGPDAALYLFSGADAVGTVQESLWRVDLAHAGEAAGWTVVAVPAGPAGRLGATLVFDPASRAGWLYGGYRAVADIPQDQADIWRLTGIGGGGPASWTAVADLVGTEQPQARSGHASAWDSIGGRMLVYGGAHSTEGDTRYLGDTWSLEPAALPSSTPTPTATSPATPSMPRIYLPWGSKP